ncbi:ZIP family metal transporter [Sphingomonas sp. MA1305]|uniref:ZIP family metal transporter n=1 Tax=Sphingomonas sp. MA1305 TaxID=2479204 RepID=UPI0018DF1CCC|nr:transporter [Sphingomonas sp. MA1305]
MLLPSAAVIGAGVFGGAVSLTRLWRSAVQHLAAGVVFAAIATEIVPGVIHGGAPGAAIAGFATGVAAMFAMRWLAERLEARDAGRAELPLGFLAAVSIDCVIDGVVIGTGFAVGARQGLLVSAALTLEMFFLGLATADTMRGGGARLQTVLATCTGLAAILGVSSIVGYLLLAGAPPVVLTALLAFGSAALLYLVTEELLVRAHDLGETRLVTSLFFLGFLIVFAAELLAVPR